MWRAARPLSAIADARRTVLSRYIGAHVGIYSLAAGRIVGPEGRVYAFEPEPGNFRLLEMNVEANGFENIVALPVAMSDRSGTQDLCVSRYCLACHSLMEDNVPDPAGHVRVETTSLDDFWEGELKGSRVDVLKTDTQGAEGLIMKGAQKFLAAIDFVGLIECWPYGLRRMGYTVEELLDAFARHDLAFEVLDASSSSRLKMSTAETIAMCDSKEDYAYHFSFLVKRAGSAAAGGGP